MDELLGPALGAEVEWNVTDKPIPDSPMARCYAQTWQIHKNDTYIPVYDSIFSPYRDFPVRMLEMGVSRGGSLQLWRKYFHPDSVIVGVDINRQCRQFNNPANHIHVRRGDQEDIGFLHSVVEEFGPFDIILDDASHLPSPTLASFQYLFPKGLRDGGVYLVEDLWFCYIPVGQEDGCPPFTEVVKYLIDVMHLAWAGKNLDESSKEKLVEAEGHVDQTLFGSHSPHRVLKHLVPLATTLISSIEIHDSLVAIHRQPRDVPRVLLNVTGDNLPDNAGPGWFDRP